jgi:hypothetical protein
MKTIKFLVVMMLIGGLFAFTACEDDDPGDLKITSIEAIGTDLETGEEVVKDLNAATAATDVPLDAVITVVFSKNVDPETLTSSSVALTTANGSATVDLSVGADRVTITPQSDLERGTEYTLELSATIQAEDGGAFTAVDRTFKTAGQGIVTPPQSDKQVAYFPFNNSMEDYTGNHTLGAKAQVSGYVKDRFGYVNSAAEFNGSTDIVDVTNPGDMVNPSTSISFWMKVDLTDPNYENGMFIMGATVEYGFFFELGKADFGPWLKIATRHKEHPDASNDFGSATAWGDAIKGGDLQNDLSGWTGDLPSMIDNKWVHVVMTYDHTTGMKRVYLNATKVWEMDLDEGSEWKMKEMHIDTASATNESMNVGIGFAGSSDNHSTGWADYQSYVDAGTAKTFSGLMDDVRFFNTALSSAEVTSLYDSEKPAE